ncbi:MAG TPA: VOC family protein [Candidatus Acidoferrales bacterium]|jgi:predicted enzyme related to lactoylglutathione lyase|nr:VOC family protein [Candidatus Acidoferrales bacterium]
MPRVVHFDIPADDASRAAAFYSKVFGWKITKWEGSGPMVYWMVSTGKDEEPGINGGLSKRQGPGGITNTIDVSSVDEYASLVTKNGGEVLTQKMPIPTVGYFALCADPEGNPFGIMQFDKTAK